MLSHYALQCHLAVKAELEENALICPVMLHAFAFLINMYNYIFDIKSAKMLLMVSGLNLALLAPMANIHIQTHANRLKYKY